MKSDKKHVKKSRKENKKTDLIVDYDKSPFQYQESVNSLRTNLKFVSMNNEYKKLIVTSSIPNEGKTSVSINLGISLAAAGSNVLLIDCDLRKPTLHRYLKIPGGTTEGLTNLIRKPGEVNVHNVRNNLYVMTAGTIPPNPTELLGSSLMGDLLIKLGERFDYVILDTPPVSVVTDAAVLSQYADGVLMVVRQKMVTFEQAKLAKKNLSAVNANILGVILNDYNSRNVDYKSGYYYSYNNYSYRYGESDDVSNS